MLESFMRNICEHIRGLVPAISRAGGIAKLLIDIGVVVLTGCCIFLVAEFVEFNREHITPKTGDCVRRHLRLLFSVH